MKIIKEFRQFIARGNVIDLAVGVIIGGAFGKIVSSIVDDLIMPPIGLILGGINFSDIKIILREAYVDAAGKPFAQLSLNIGNFLQVLLNFIIIAICIFVIVKAVNKLEREMKFVKEVEKKVEAKTDPQVELLTEIRDLLRKTSGEVRDDSVNER
jgi:large conductance mechanosensitive channel